MKSCLESNLAQVVVSEIAALWRSAVVPKLNLNCDQSLTTTLSPVTGPKKRHACLRLRSSRFRPTYEYWVFRESSGWFSRKKGALREARVVRRISVLIPIHSVRACGYLDNASGLVRTVAPSDVLPIFPGQDNSGIFAHVSPHGTQNGRLAFMAWVKVPSSR